MSDFSASNMSRIPQPSSSSRSTPSSPKKTPSKLTTGVPRVRPPPSPTPSRATPSGLRPQASAKNLRATTPTKVTGAPRPATLGRRTQPPVFNDEPPVPKAPTLSVREQIALKRAAAQKAAKERAQNGGASDDFQGLEDASPMKEKEDMFDLGRWSVKETIERARSSGVLNIASRGLPCLPAALFEIHLGVTPEPLKSVPEEPPITTATTDDVSSSRRRGGSSSAPAWFEGKDLEIIKAWSNEIIEIQPEISMFGSLKTVDLHRNKLTSLPDSITDLMCLAILDISHNELTSLPSNIWAMPSLTTLNVSYNALTALPFSSAFTSGSNATSRTTDSRGDWFSEAITRATTTLPKLLSLDASHNEIAASGIDTSSLPAALTKIDISFNPLGNSVALVQALSRLANLQEVHAEFANISNDSFPVDLFASSTHPFPRLSLFDVGETQVTLPAVEAAFQPTLFKQKLEWELLNEPPASGALRVVVGKKVVKEAWELEIERRTRLTAARHARTESMQSNATATTATTENRATSPKEPAKEQWEIQAENGMLTEGAKRRARAAAAVQAAADLSLPSATTTATPRKQQPVKESWEIEAEQGLLTAGGRRRARAQAAMASAGSGTPSSTDSPALSPSPSGSISVTLADALSHPQHYNKSSKSLTLPPSAPPSRTIHSRSFSLVANIPPSGSTSEFSLIIPTPSLPLAAIVPQPFAENLKTLVLSQRRMDPSFSLPAGQNGPFLPSLEELRLDNCNLVDNVPVGTDGPNASGRSSEPLLPTISRLFPSLKILDLSYNNISSAAFTTENMETLILASTGDFSSRRVGLRQLLLRGNRITDVEGFQTVAQLFKGHKSKADVETFKLEELDLRDNEIAKLSPELGLMPLDVLLVDGNVFRVPPRRVWEREGTKGLLSWLRGRIE
ncbi:L domain-like protein [Cristinia sonorae]|uniref:L domain-like protein n=1 Tax=Cristinia sonorae TaxID=1940300 RepID=A0A8K0XMA8_9AGAR|nr:L domain-like protein [Cristinia sonorae]